MVDNTIPRPRPLVNKPLVEAIFELRWQLKPVEGGPPQDPGFRIALGRFYDRVAADYPIPVDLPTVQVPEDMTAYAVRHQFRAKKDGWPVTQLGPGILTVNETAGYTWETFRPRVLSAVKSIFEAYPNQVFPFVPITAQLRYIDAVQFDPKQYDPTQFLSEFFHTNVTVDAQLTDPLQSPSAPASLSLNFVYRLASPLGVGILGFAVGEHNGRPSIIMEISVRSESVDAPKTSDAFDAWLTSAHNVAVDKWFYTLCRGSLMQSFEASHGNTNG